MRIQSINPATESVNKEFDALTKDQVRDAAKNSRKAFKSWSASDISERAGLLSRLSATLKQKSREYGRLMTVEMGKPIKQSVSEVEKCAWAAEVFAENAERWLADEQIETDYRKASVVHQPLGVILGIMPWNFPFWQAMRFAIPALAAGNTAILRHSNVCPMSALAIEESFRLSGFPDSTFQTIISDHDAVGMLVRGRGMVDGVSLTGSVEAGKRIGALAGKNIKKLVLELGGSDPFIVLDDADLSATCRGACDGRMINSGQSCICSKRFIVVRERAEEFTNGLAEQMRSQKIGDPLDESTAVGPLANAQQLQSVERQVNESVAMGASVLCGGKRASVNGKGFFYEPTVLSGVRPNMPVAKEEVFGPVAPVIVVRNEKEAIRLANSSRFGLGASVWTSDMERGERVARLIESGQVFVNHIVVSDPRLPFGGVKESGVGRELSRYGILEFTNAKSIVVG
jgi:acyl-CoA reductase-like NAD-dependent aldehyde dehydrogenase